MSRWGSRPNLAGIRRATTSNELGGLLGGVQAGLGGRLAGEPVEVGEPGDLRRAPVDDAMRVDDDPGVLGLAKDLGQANPRNRVRGEQVAQDLTGADGGELVDIANEQQMRSLGNRLDEFVGQDHVHHRTLIDDDQIGGRRILAVISGFAAGLRLQQPMHGQRVLPGQLGEALGGPAGGRDQQHCGLLGCGKRDDGADSEALAAARPAGEHSHLAGESKLDGVLLAGSEILAGPGAQPVQGLGPVDVGERGQPLVAGVQEVQQPASEAALRSGKRHQVDSRQVLAAGRVASGDRFSDHAVLGHQLLQARVNQLAVHLQDRRGLADQLRLGQVAVAVVSGLGEGVFQAGLDALRAVVRDAERLSKSVSGPKADAPHL